MEHVVYLKPYEWEEAQYLYDEMRNGYLTEEDYSDRVFSLLSEHLNVTPSDGDTLHIRHARTAMSFAPGR